MSETKFRVLTVFLNSISGRYSKCFLVFNATLDVRWTNIIP